jgi:hypothetical protein
MLRVFGEQLGDEPEQALAPIVPESV